MEGGCQERPPRTLNDFPLQTSVCSFLVAFLVPALIKSFFILFFIFVVVTPVFWRDTFCVLIEIEFFVVLIAWVFMLKGFLASFLILW